MDGETRDLRAPRDVEWIARRLSEAGFEAWAVGGAVRDALIGNPPGDWDLTTSARPADVRRIFKRTVPIGIEHGTVGVVAPDGRMYEVTTFRRDVETFGRKARVVFADTLEEDLKRRDFTINAVAWNPMTRVVRDPEGGLTDLDVGVLRTVGNPEERFWEDRLRVLRALRFAGRFELRIDDGTWEAIRGSAGLLGNLSAERIREELYKVLALRRPSVSLRLYEESGVLRALYPELAAGVGVPYRDSTIWDFSLRIVDAASAGRPSVRLAGLYAKVGFASLEGAGPPGDGGEAAAASAAAARTATRRLKTSNAESDRIVHLVAQHASAPSPGDTGLRRWVRQVGRDYLADTFRLLVAEARATGDPQQVSVVCDRWRGTRAVLAQRPPLEIRELAIGGAELRGLGIRPGPIYGEILEALLERTLEDPALNQRDRLVELVEEERGKLINEGMVHDG